ncbi:hypothetical protein Dimus_006664 [Dionaea muscipula]
MVMDADQWQQLQEMELARPMEEITPSTNSLSGSSMLERRACRPQKDQTLNCPRCNSTNTKFCYYNNYSLTQPRYFCKTCRRYWTQGGSLRNVPVGGGSRKNKRSTSSSSSSSSSSSPSSAAAATTGAIPGSTSLSCPQFNLMIPDLNPPISCHVLSQLMINPHHHPQNPSKIHHDQQGNDLNLAFPPCTQDYQGTFQPLYLPKIEIIDNNKSNNNNHHMTSQLPINSSSSCCSSSSPSPLSALELLRTGIASRGDLNPYIPMAMSMAESNAPYPSGFPLHQSKPNLSFPAEGMGSRVCSLVGVQKSENGGAHARLLFPFGDMKQLSSASTVDEVDHSKELHDELGSSTPLGFWNGMLGAGGGTW